MPQQDPFGEIGEIMPVGNGRTAAGGRGGATRTGGGGAYAGMSPRDVDWAIRRAGHQQPVRMGGGDGGAFGKPTKRTTQIGAQTIERAPYDPELYKQFTGAIAERRAGGLEDLTAAKEFEAGRLQQRTRSGVAARGLGTRSGVAAAAEAEALNPFYAKMALMEQDRINTFWNQLFSAYAQAVTPFAKEQIGPRTDIATYEYGGGAGGGGGGGRGQPIRYKGRTIGFV